MTNKTVQKLLERKFLVIAHRGASHYAPENTMAAFKLAYQMKSDMIELDVQLSKDGVPVVFHDAKLHHHSNGKGLLSSYTFRELRLLDAGKWFDSEFVGEQIPSLEEVLEWASGKILLNIEIKTEAVSDTVVGGVEEKVVQMVQQSGMKAYTSISSFDYRAVERIKKIDPDMLTGLLYHKKSSLKRDPAKLLHDYRADYFHCGKSEMNRSWLSQLQNQDKQFLIYTVNKKSQMEKWIEKGAFGVFSDKPDLLYEVRQAFLK